MVTFVFRNGIMKKLRWLTGLMGITLIVITGFQAYWLKNNYDREKKTMEIKAQIQFQETVRRLQVIKFKLGMPGDSLSHSKMRVFVTDEVPGEKELRLNFSPGKTEVITMVNSIRDKINDTLTKVMRGPGIIIGRQKGTLLRTQDSMHGQIEERLEMNGKNVYKYLSGVDSLQDSLKIPEITAAYTKSLKEEKLGVPFNIIRLDSAKFEEGPDMAHATVGFSHPITYELQLGNSFSYLIKKISLPILFSIFLVGVTLLSFVLLYRTLLKQHRLAEIKNEFISNITHELKTPIATVGVAIEALKNFNAMQDPQRTREYLDISSNELQRLSLLVDKVLKLSMLEKKEIELKYETVDLLSVVNEVATSMRLQLEKYHATLRINTEGDVNLFADRLHLLSVVFNLLDNSLKYSKGEPAIRISLKGTDHEVELRITDNGIGISPEFKNKVFEKFFRVPSGNTHNTKGYGLGLSYVAHIVQKHKGTVSVESKEGKGTEFIINLPKEHAGN